MDKAAATVDGGRFRMSTRRAAFTAGIVFTALALAACLLGTVILSAGASRADRAAEAGELDAARKDAKSASGLLRVAWGFFVALLVAEAVLAAAWITLIYRWITGTVKEMTWQIQQVSAGDGDLTRRVVVRDRRVFGSLADSINAMIGALQGSVAEISRIASDLNSSAEQMSAVIQQMNASSQDISNTIAHIAKGGEEQARRVLETSHSMELMNTSIQEMAEKADLSNQAAMEAIEIAQRGAEAAVETATAMDVIREAAEAVVEASAGLEERFMQIGIIVDVITSVADQTNLLALNAAIEAARAGEQGRGFAVVAEEVRNLAENSRKSAEQIANLIREIESGVNRMRTSIDSAIEQVKGGTEVVEKAGKALQEIAVTIQTTSRYANEIAEITRRQVKENEEALKAITEIASIADETAASSEEASATVEEQTASMQEMAAAAAELAAMAEKLNQLVGGFKV
ncbi:methyl-accepting chemotaxis protein [Candidatus Solincola tengchongensis]|uniref:methyl-accepting chemotaxis protein n=1 Tax=Candidatus Solincola tengchongensis TaxID=2900693 RepID=UPI00257DBE12|nr:methyl-accepting chemotaxis protein [Candidatus Solincola tengchongensis]